MEKQDIRKTKTCEKCKTSVEISKMKFYPKNKDEFMVICDKCFIELKNKIMDKKKKDNMFTENRTAKPITLGSKPLKQTEQVSDKTNFLCGRCNYSFKLDENKVGYTDPKCPYCGKIDKIRRK